MLIRSHIGVSLDGFVATSDGLTVWNAVPSFGPGTHGVAPFSARCGAVVVGRNSFDQGFEAWLADWPWSDKRLYVLTSRPLPKKASKLGVVASQGGPERLVKHLRDAGLAHDVQVLGGPQTVRAFLSLGALDQLGLVVLPVLPGKGIPLFECDYTTYSDDAWTPSQPSSIHAKAHALLRLEHLRSFPDGAVGLVYTPK